MILRNALNTASILSALTASAALASEDILPSADDTFTKWGEDSGWIIYVDHSRNSCLIERIDENANVVQMGLTPGHDIGYLGVFTRDDVGLKGDREEIVLSLDGNLYSAEAHKKTTRLADGYTGGYILANNPNFVNDVMKKHDMIVFPEKEFAFIVSLAGTNKAIEAARRCNIEQGH